MPAMFYSIQWPPRSPIGDGIAKETWDMSRRPRAEQEKAEEEKEIAKTIDAIEAKVTERFLKQNAQDIGRTIADTIDESKLNAIVDAAKAHYKTKKGR
jgi:hypothetical protein